MSFITADTDLNLDDVVTTAIIIAIAGHETTANLLGTGAARERLVANLASEASMREPDIPALPAVFDQAVFDLGLALYGSLGVARDDIEGRRKAKLRNYRFYDAPLAGIVCMNRELRHVDSLGVGMFLQTFLLALTERGLGSCVRMVIAAYRYVGFMVSRRPSTSGGRCRGCESPRRRGLFRPVDICG